MGVFVGVGTKVGVFVGKIKMESISAPSFAMVVGAEMRSHCKGVPGVGIPSMSIVIPVFSAGVP